MIEQQLKMIFVLLSTEKRPLDQDIIYKAIDKIITIIPGDREDIFKEISEIISSPAPVEDAMRTARTLLPRNGSVEDGQINEVISKILTEGRFAGIDPNELRKELKSNYNVRIDDFTAIERKPEPWVYKRMASIKWSFWNSYSRYLEQEKNMPISVVNQIGRLTERTLDGVFDPTTPGKVSRYGLVVGQVQSGKTSNYTGLICKAVDSGFNLVIVLAGTQNSLRTQTQLRIDEGFLGFDTQFQRAFNTGQHNIGVGIGRAPLPVHSITSSDNNGDISNNTTLTFHTNEPIIAVIKKNKPRLEKLVRWLASQATIDTDGERRISSKKLLLIDDEADQASINTSPENDPASTTNRLIREVISLFNKVGYVGYTATPFANIFIPIEEDQLFPSDFIINLPAPSNYIGPDKVFGFSPLKDDEDSDTVLPVVRRISDYETFVPDRHKKGEFDDWKTREKVPADKIAFFKYLAPESLHHALKSFIITCAIRRLRGQISVHNSMLIHVTRYQNWQKLILRVVEEIFNFYKLGIEMKTPSVISELKEVFDTDGKHGKSYLSTTNQILENGFRDLDHRIQVHDWDDVSGNIYDAISRIQIREINGGSKEVLNYYEHNEGLSVIAIGGDKLSRGLTLEGLSISYYLRASKMYDTLMQMGRWFGYRDGYTDLCRLYTSREINEWFCHITHASEELRNEFDYMADVAGSTPEKYALKVRTHPGVLQITASNKIRRAVDISVSWAGRLVESYELSKDPKTISNNLEATRSLISQLGGNFETVRGNYLWKAVSTEKISSFLRGFRLSENLKAADPANLLRFINIQISNGELTEWTVALVSKQLGDVREQFTAGGKTISAGCYLRNYDDGKSSEEIYFLKKSRLINPIHEFIDLESEEYNLAMAKSKEAWKKRNKTGQPSYPNGEIVRNEIKDPKKPLLLIYLLDPIGANREQDAVKIVENIAAYAISFPASRFNAAVSYKIPEQLLPFFDQEFEQEEDVEDEDEY